MKKAVKYAFHSSLILRRNKRINENCPRKLQCSRNGGVSSYDIRYCSAVLFYSSFNISDHKCDMGGKKGGCTTELNRRVKGHRCGVSPEGKPATNAGNNKLMPQHPIPLSSRSQFCFLYQTHSVSKANAFRATLKDVQKLHFTPNNYPNQAVILLKLCQTISVPKLN